MKQKSVIVLGAGFGGMSAAAYIAKQGHNVTVIEKNSLPGGRAQVYKTKGYTFDLGPSWYMMPDVFEEFFGDFSSSPSDFYDLKKLNPAYEVVGRHTTIQFKKYKEMRKKFDELDPGILAKMDRFFAQTKQDYGIVRNGILLKPMTRLKETLDKNVLKFLASKAMRQSYAARIESLTNNEDIRRSLQFMSVFMGGSPDKIPGVYALLAYVDMGLGVHYPMGGFGKLASSFQKVAEKQGAKFIFNAKVKNINSNGKIANSVELDDGKIIEADIIVANADYHHVETKLLKKTDRNYSPQYWEKLELSPSALLILLGVKKKLPKLSHHTLFLESDWHKHFSAIASGSIETNPLFYVSAPSKTDPTVAPSGHENLFILAPMPAGTNLSLKNQKIITDNIISRIEKHCGLSFNSNIVIKKYLDQNYFEQTFNAFKGNAFGPSHSLRQTAIFRTRMKSKKLKNLYFVGQYTNPGTGVPMVVLSGKAVGRLIAKDLQND